MNKVAIETVVIPRYFNPQTGELMFFVAFHFPIRGDDNTITPVSLATSSGALPDCLKNKDKPWPTYVKELFDAEDRVQFELFDRMELKFQTSKLKRYRTHDLVAAGWNIRNANQLWNSLVWPTVQGHSAASQEHFISLLDDAADGKLENDVNRLVDAEVDPWAASDLRPGLRLESFDSRVAARALATQKIEPTDGNKKPQLKGLKRILDLQKEDPQFLTHIVNRNPDLYQVALNLLKSYDSEDPRFFETIEKKLRKEQGENNKFIEAMNSDIVDTDYQEYIVSFGQTEFRREQRFIKSSRHRIVQGVNEPLQTAMRQAAADQFVSTNGDSSTKQTSFRDVVALAGQHPGLARRLSLVTLLGVELDDSVPNKIPEARVRLTVKPGVGETVTDCQFVAPAPVTACELLLGDTRSNSIFRPRAKTDRVRHFVDKSGLDPTDTWRRHHVLPSKFFEASQDDYSQSAGRAEMGVNETPSDATVGSQGIAPEDPLQHQTPAVNLYLRPSLDSQGGGIRDATVSEDLHRKLQASKQQLVAYNKGARNWLIAQKAMQSPFHVASFQGDLVGESTNPKYYAEDLIVGHTVFARARGENRTKTWRSLCRRMVVLEIKPNPANELNPRGYRLEFEEEGAIANSIVAAPAPFVGVVIETKKEQVTRDDGVSTFTQEETVAKVALIQSDNQEWKAQQFVLPPEYADGVAKHDYVLMSPRVTSDKFKVAGANAISVDEVEVHPILKEAKLDRDAAWQDDDRLKTLVSDHLINLTEPIIVSSRISKAGTARPNLLLPVRITPFATRFLNAQGKYIEPTIKPKVGSAPAAIPVIEPANDYAFLVEGEQRHYGWPTGYPTPTGAATAFETLRQPHLLSIGLQSPSPFLVADPESPNQLLKFGGDPPSNKRTSVRGIVQRVEFELLAPIKRGDETGCDIKSAALLDPKVKPADQATKPKIPKSFWKFVGDVPLPAGFSLEKPVAAPAFPISKESNYAIVSLRGVCVSNTVTGNKTLTWQVTEATVLSELDSPAAQPPEIRLTWRLPIQQQTGSVITVLHPESSSSESEPDSSLQMHPCETSQRFVEVPVSLEGNDPQTAEWPYHPFGGFHAKGNKFVFPDGDVLNNVKSVAASPDRFGYFQLSLNKAKRLQVASAINLEPARILGEIVEVAEVDVKGGGKRIEITLENSQGRSFKIIEDRFDVVLETPPPNSKSGISHRMLLQLQVGEFLAASCEPDKENAGLLRFRHHSNGLIAKATAYLLGELVTPKTAIANVTAEGSVRHRACRLTTERGKLLTVWTNETYSEQPLRVSFHSGFVVDARTITQYLAPTNPVDAGGRSKRALHATVSELLGRWAGWSLTTPQPGKADEDTCPDQLENAPFTIEAIRPRLASGRVPSPTSPHYPSDVDSWKLPPLRFGKQYELCVRRADLAGNHFYDEPLPDDISDGYRHLAPLLSAEAQTFTRTDLPAPPVVAFSNSSDQAAYIKVAQQAEARQEGKTRPPNPQLQVDPSTAAKFSNLEYPERERELLLLSDVMHGHATLSDDAGMTLLPPPCPVETVMLHGKYDGNPSSRVAYSIRWHEKHLEDQVLGLYHGKGFLNYFPDPVVSDVEIQLGMHLDEMTAGSPITLSGSPIHARFFSPKRWPQVQCIRLELGASGRALRDYEPTFPVRKPGRPQRAPSSPPLVRLNLPPGAMGQAVIRQPGVTRDPNSVRRWPPIQLVHATNGAWLKPKWDFLEEASSATLEPSAAARKLQGKLQIDVATTGGYSVQAYWNEPWDESLPTQHEPAEAILEVENGEPTRCKVTNPGFGFGTRATILFENLKPQKEPQFRISLYCGTITGIAIHHPGVGLKANLRLTIYTPGYDQFNHYRPARAIAHVGRSGVVEHVEILDHGSCLGVDPSRLRMSTLSIGYPNLKVELKSGQVDAVTILSSDSRSPHQTHYSGDIKLRIIRRPPFYRPAEATIESFDRNGGIHTIKMTQAGGFYGETPFVIAHDPTGNGYGAELKAVSDLCGGIARVEVIDAGRGYSDETFLSFYTNTHQIQEEMVPPKLPESGKGTLSVAFEHPLSTERARVVDYVAVLSSRFRKYILDEKEGFPSIAALANSEDQVRLRRHVPRLSEPQKVSTASFSRPLSPDIAHLMPAFEWKAETPNEIDLETAQSWFRTHSKGDLRIQRLELVRVYLHRPWFKSGLNEQLAVIIEPATLNSIRYPIDQNKLSPVDRGVHNEATHADETGELSAKNEQLKYHTFSELTRNYISRWGFDPTVREVGFPPLSVNHFRPIGPDRVHTSRERLAVPGVAEIQKVIQLAGHEVHYDAAKERWYADIRVDLGLEQKQPDATPIVELALAAFQPDGQPNQRLSPIVKADMYKLLGDRILEVRRHSQSSFSIDLHGQFDHAPVSMSRTFPVRQAVVKLESRDLDLPLEIAELDGDAEEDAGNRVIKEFQLSWVPKAHAFAGRIEFAAEFFNTHGHPEMLALTIEEYDIRPVAADHDGLSDGRGDSMLTIDGQLCTKKIVFSTTLEIGKQNKQVGG